MTLIRNNQKYNWCTKDCHNKLIWCGRPNCRLKEEFKRFKEAERETKKDVDRLLVDFKVALAVICLDKEY